MNISIYKVICLMKGVWCEYQWVYISAYESVGFLYIHVHDGLKQRNRGVKATAMVQEFYTFVLMYMTDGGISNTCM